MSDNILVNRLLGWLLAAGTLRRGGAAPPQGGVPAPRAMLQRVSITLCNPCVLCTL